MTPYQPRRDTGVKLMIDTNCINARQQNVALNKFEQWRASGVIRILMAERAKLEARFGRNAQREQRAAKFIFINSALISEDQKARYAAIEAALFPAGVRRQSERSDVEIVYQASDWGCILVTNDGDSASQPRGIFGVRGELLDLGITVMRPEEAVAYVQNKIRQRDQQILIICDAIRVARPEWLGQD